MTARGKQLYGAAICLILCAALFAIGFAKGLEHTVAGLPHWATACPEGAVGILVIGQSQASNTGPRRHISFSGSRAFANGKCFYLRDPMPGTAGRGGSIWPRFADKLGRRVVIANISISGSAIEEWTIPQQLARIRETLAQLRAAGYSKPLIIWMQGETDGARRSSSDAYYSHLKVLVQIAPYDHWLISRESICYDMQTKWAALDTARARIAHEFKTVTIGPDLDKIGLIYRQADRCHLNADGQAALAGELAVAAMPVLPR